MREPNVDRAHRMLGRILDDLDATPVPGPWISAARTLSERLIISEDTFYYFTDKFTESLIFEAMDTDAEAIALEEQMRAIERAHGLRDGEYWRLDEAPPEWLSLNDSWDARTQAIVAQYLRSTGHADVATMVVEAPDEFEARSSRGFADLWGEEEDELDDL